MVTSTAAPPAVSNTGGANYKAVSGGIDTLYLNVRLRPPEEFYARLADCKQSAVAAAEARREDGGKVGRAEPVPSGFTFNGAPLLVQPAGSAQWPYVLVNDWVRLSVGSGAVGGVFIRARLSALYLWSIGYERAVCEWQAWLYEWFGPEFAASVQVSEVHVCLDVAGFSMATDLDSLSVKQWVRHSGKIAPLFSGARLETVAIGSRSSPCSAVVYDKLAEIFAGGGAKAWMFDIWRQHGWDGEAPVTRVEFRIKRERLRELHIDTPDQLLDQLPAVWAYCTLKFLRQVVYGGEGRNRTRLPLTLWWRCVVRGLDDECVSPLARDVQHAAQADALLAQASGCLVGYGALTGGDLLACGQAAIDRIAEVLARLGLETFEQFKELRSLRYAGKG